MKNFIWIIFLTAALIYGQTSVSNNFVIKKKASALIEKNSSSGGKIIFNIFDDELKPLYSVTKKAEYDIPQPDAVLFKDGTLMLVSEFITEAEFYDPEGNMFSRFKMLKDSQPEYERSIFADAGINIAALLISEPGNSSSKIVLINKSGIKKSEWEISFTNGSGIKILDDENILAVSAYRWKDNELIQITSFYDLNGNLVYSVPKMFKSAVFNFDGSLFIGLTNKNMFCINLKDKKLMWEKSAGKNKMFMQAAFNNSGMIYVETTLPTLIDGKWIYKNAYLYKSSIDGIELGRKNIPSGEFENLFLLNNRHETNLIIDDKIQPVSTF